MLAILKHILFRYLKKHDRPFVAPRIKKWGGPQAFHTYEEVKKAFSLTEGPDALKSGDLKTGIADLLIEFLTPLRQAIYEHYSLCQKAYPDTRPLPTLGVANTRQPKAPKNKNQGPPLTPAALDVKVGKIVDVKRVEESDKLYVEQIDVGEGKLRTVVSGLVHHVSIDEMQNRLVLLVCNLKPAKLAGIESHAMVLAAATREKEPKIELVNVPPDAKIGERITFDGFESVTPDAPFISQARWKKLQKDFVISEDGVAMHKDKAFKTSAGVCTSNLTGGTIS